MMTPQEFSKWCAQVNLTPEGIEFARWIRNSKLVRERSDQGTAGNRRTRVVQLNRSVHLASLECRAFSQFLTRLSLELRLFWDEPPPIDVSFINGKGHRVCLRYTADFVIMRDGSMDFVDISSEDRLVAKARRMPGFIVKEVGVWRCPPMEEALSRWGIGFIVWTPQSASLQSINKTAGQL